MTTQTNKSLSAKPATKSSTRAHPRLQKLPKGHSLTQQSALAETDINQIMSRYHKTGFMPPALHQNSPHYGDFSKIQDYHSATNAIKFANSQFESLPSDIRASFGNDPHLFLEFMSDPDNLDQAVELGLVKKPPVKKSAGTSEIPTKGVTDPAVAKPDDTPPKPDA